MTASWRTAVGQDSGLGDYTIKYDLQGDGFIVIDRDSVTNDDRPADVTFSAKIDVIEGILAGTINPTKAMLRGKVKVSPMKMATKIGAQLEALMSRMPKGAVDAPRLDEDEDLVDHPLPPRTDNMILATPEMFDPEKADSFKDIPGFEAAFARATQIRQQTSDRFDVQILKANPRVAWTGSPWHMHHHDIAITYILQGWAEFEFEGVGVVRFEKGMLMNQPANNRHREGVTSNDFMGIAFIAPAKFATTLFIWNDETQEYDEIYIEDSTGGSEEFGKLQSVEVVA
jgi:putative sterol carrier protein/quercetin dioxygenase-like cupin family protein